METARLRSVIAAVLADNKRYNWVALLTAVEQSYSTSVTSPSAQSAEAFSGAMEALSNACSESEVSSLPPSRMRTLEQLGGDKLFGSGAVAAIEHLLHRSATPAATLDGLSTLKTDAQQFIETISGLRTALAKLGVEPEVLPPGSAEVEVALPSVLFSGSLGGLANETRLLDRALSDIVEAASGSRDPLLIRTVSSGSVEIYLTIEPAAGLLVLTVVRGIVELINSVLTTRKTMAELEKIKAPKSVLDPMQEWEKNRIEGELDRLREELLERSPVDAARKNELRTGLSRSLRYLADRMDKGMDVDVASGPIEPTSPGAEGEAPVPPSEASLAQQRIREARVSVGSLPRNREPILLLKPSTDEIDDPPLESAKGSSPPPRKRQT